MAAETNGNGGCKYCGKPIAWRKVCVPGGPRSGVNRPFEPVLDADGNPVRRLVRSGTDRHGNPKMVNRVVPTDVMHRCRTHTPAPSWTPTESTCPPEATDETPATPESTPAPEAPEAPHNPATGGPRPITTEDLAALAALLAGPVTAQVRGEIVDLLKSYGVEPPPQRHEFHTPGGTFTTEPGEIVHVNIPKVIRLITRTNPDGTPRPRHVYVYGPAGSGKTYGLAQAARLAGRTDVKVIPFAGMSVGRLFGMPTVSGEWQRGALTDAVEFGHVVVADEFDRALPQVAVTLNAVLENGYFMDGNRQVKVNPNFVLLASGNTDGRGATRQATSAQPMDQPTLARFAFISWGYDEAHEVGLAKRHLSRDDAEALATWTRAVRRICDRDHVESFTCGPRETANLAEDLANGADLAEAAETWVWRGLKADTVRRILHEAPLPRIGGRS